MLHRTIAVAVVVASATQAASARAEPGGLGAEVHTVLAIGELDLGDHGLVLDIVTAEDGRSTVFLSHADPHCSLRRDLGRLPSERAEAIVRAAAAVAEMVEVISARDSCAASRRWSPERREALMSRLPRHGDVTHGLVAGVGGGVGGILLISAIVDDSLEDSRAAVGVIGGLWTAGTVVGLARAETPHGLTITATTTLLGFGAGSATLAYAGELRAADGDVWLGDRRHDGLLIAGGAFAATAVVYAYDRLSSPRASTLALYRARRLAASGGLSAPDLDRLERDLEREEPGLSPWLVAAPLVAGAGALVVHASLVSDSGERNLDLVLAGALATSGLLLGLAGGTHKPDRYTEPLSDLGLSIGPAGVAVRGAF